MFSKFMDEFLVGEDDEILELGVTSDRTYSSSNYFVQLYPFKHRIVAAGLDNASFLERLYPGVRFVHANALALPFADKSFDYVHSSAVLEHVGNFENQAKMIAECVRVARKGIYLTTPNRWFPIEFHTQLPIVHWLPKSIFRWVLSRLGQHSLAREENLNLMTRRELALITQTLPDFAFYFASASLLGWTSNLILVGRPL